ncbi:MAG: helix-turn-helix domain-containing protein [Candidatus Dadabacteria bacterium]|nr:helix-turn-helix domain-containing protein [Candidatus Dadabacteria bacterium]
MHELETHTINRFIELRKQTGLSRIQFGAMLGMTYANVYNIETGKHLPTLVTVGQLCKVYNITPSEFFSENPIRIKKN